MAGNFSCHLQSQKESYRILIPQLIIFWDTNRNTTIVRNVACVQARGPEPGAGGRGGSAHGAETPGGLECRGLQYHEEITLMLRRGDICLDAGGSVLARRMLMEHGAHAHVASQIIPTAVV